MLAKMLYKRVCHSLTSLNGQLYAAGGFNGKEFLDSFERYVCML